MTLQVKMSSVDMLTLNFLIPDFTDWHRTSHAQRGVGGCTGVAIKGMVPAHARARPSDRCIHRNQSQKQGFLKLAFEQYSPQTAIHFASL